MMDATASLAPDAEHLDGVDAAEAASDDARSRKGVERRPRGSLYYRGLLVIYLISTPFYLWQSGVPQVSDFLGVVLMFSLAPWGLRFVFQQTQRRSFVWLAGFAGYTIVVSLTWFILYPEPEFLIFPCYYVFNTLVFASAFGAYYRMGEEFLSYLAWGVVLSVVVQVALSPFVTGRLVRETLFFNNPNQLGYYALVSATIICLSFRSGHIRLFPTLFGVACCLWLIALSLSKAAIIALGGLGIIAALGNTRLVLAMCFLVALVIPAELTVVDKVGHRMEDIGEQSDDSWEGRGYGRIVDNPEYLVFGAAEGGFARLELPPHGYHEIHSSIATVLFSYGIVGSFLFVMFLIAVCLTAGFRNSLYILPVMAYAMTHMGLREGLFWLVLAQMSLLGMREQQS